MYAPIQFAEHFPGTCAQLILDPHRKLTALLLQPRLRGSVTL